WWPVADNDFIAGSDDTETVREQILRDLREPVEDLAVHVAEGAPDRIILDTAQRENCDLIVLGDQGPTFAGVVFTTTAIRVLQRAPCSVLIAKARPHGPYRQLLVGTDFTAESRHSLQTAATWFADAELALLHALDIPYRSLLLEAGRGDEMARMEREAMQTFIDEADLPTAVKQRMDMHVEHGYPETVLHKYASTHDNLLTVIGALKRGPIFHVLIGGEATRIVQKVPGDVLMVRAEQSDSG